MSDQYPNESDAAALQLALYEITFAMQHGFAAYAPAIAEAHLADYPGHEWAINARAFSEHSRDGRGHLDAECEAACEAIEAANAAGRWSEGVRIGAAWSSRARAIGYFPPRELAERLAAAAVADGSRALKPTPETA